MNSGGLPLTRLWRAIARSCASSSAPSRDALDDSFALHVSCPLQGIPTVTKISTRRNLLGARCSVLVPYRTVL